MFSRLQKKMKKLILLFSLILAPASVYTEDFKTKLNLSPSSNSHKRFKREWIWNQMHIMEEINSPLPHHVGKITSSSRNKNAMYVLEGEYANSIFKVREDTGDVYAFERLDREKKSEYELTALFIDRTTNKSLEPPSKFIIKVYDVNDNVPVFVQKVFNGSVPEMSPVGTSVTKVTAVDADDPTVAGHATVIYQVIQGERYFTVDESGVISTAIADLDRENQSTYEIVVKAKDSPGLHGGDSSTATVIITLSDINDNFPTFEQQSFHFKVFENVRVGREVGKLKVQDSDDPQNRNTKYSFVRGDYRDTFEIIPNAFTNEGIIKPKKPLDYEKIKEYKFDIEATDPTVNMRFFKPGGTKSIATVTIEVLDVDEPPIFSQISATDKDEMLPGVNFKYSLTTEDSNFTLVDNHDNTANVTVKYGQFNRELVKIHYLPVVISDNGTPELSSTNTLSISVCKCDEKGEFTFCEEANKQVGVSIQALVAIFICILTILVITLLIILRKRHKKELTVLRKSVAEIHEQLVTYDEEGGGEMDTTSYDVSVLNSVRKNGMNLEPGPCLYAQVKKPTRNGNSGTGEMAIMIEVKKDEADNDGDLLPYDTLHIYGYEGAESIAESLSSLESGSSDSDIDYDFLNDWGPRFKMLAELYGLEPNEDFVY
uniref:Cadherin-5 n=1 Tax=Chelonoidis abingdonii TaxID=106734 RepID=A0A8C0IQ52_CHEAB